MALIAIPVAVAGILAGLRLRDAATEVQVYTRIEQLATLSDRTSGLVQELEDERDVTVRFLSLSRKKRDDLSQTLREQYAATDRSAQNVRGALGALDPAAHNEQIAAKLRDIAYRLDTLGTVRQLSGTRSASASSTLDVYGQLVASLIGVDDLVAQGSPDPGLAESTRAFAALARAKDHASQERARVDMTLLAGRFANPADREGLQALRSQQDSQIALFRAIATPAERQIFEDLVTGPEIGQVERTYQQALIRSGNDPNLSVRPLRPRDSVEWNRVATARLEQMRGAEQRLAAAIGTRATELKDGAWRRAFTDAAVLIVGLLLAGIATVVVARSLVRPLRRLQVGALEVADNRLPSLVDRLRDPDAASGGIEVEPIDVHSTDEIGQVARAFDEVHREAVRLAADEAVLRGNINAMFVNLSRRSQTLIERQLQLIEELEQSERDEEQLANLFRLDHLATRMRRNCENLLVLGGQDQVRRWNRPVPLIDIVRASLSEVEQYERVALRVAGDMTVAGPVVNDLVHLLAELVENATVFSDERTKVTISGQALSGGGAMLQITDNGVGMSQEELEDANWRLANPPVIDFSAARRMGLFVVGRLAVRHGVRVELRAAQGGGLTAFVLLPEPVISPGDPGGIGSRAFGRDSGMHEVVPALAGDPRLNGGPAAPHHAPQDTGGFGAFGGPGQPPRPRGTGPLPAISGDTGQFPALGGGDTGQFPAVRGETGPLPALGGGRRHAADGPPPRRSDTGQFPAIGATGRPPAEQPVPPAPPSRPAVPRHDGTGPLPVQSGETGPPPVQRGETGPLPPQRGETGPLPVQRGGTGPIPVQRGETGPIPAVRPDAPDRPAPGGDLPVRTPGAQLPGRASRSTTPDQDLFQPSPARRQAADPTTTGPLPPPSEPVPPVPEGQRRPFSWDTGPLRPPSEDGAAEQPPRRPAPPPRPVRPPTPPAAPPRRTSPIFDAMQSEWFQRRSGSATDDPAKGWESPADAGFQAAESLRSPVEGERTAVGLPKRVPGRNRVPGAVSPQPQPQIPVTAERRPETEQGISADTVRNRFASLQRGVQRGRTETRGESGPAGNEGPSHDDGETGGSR
ncbi:nitrate- and nitrite sensing domain-containing protein [Actinomadura flavalba]|uniref:sensor histidine kinase n=1 Tax=Actinomadura flavalba TaxID=1120938 RepID=UPI0003670B90|nr:nitrate- and nitrite sensing domain-containing protein [Actinomadura flavalba]